MAKKRILYFTAGRVTLFEPSGGRLAAEAVFPSSEEGAAAFAEYLGKASAAVYALLIDIVEEDFHQENIPFVRGKDRTTLLQRKLAQRYRDTSLSLAMSLGYERTQRRDERMLFSSFTNTQQFQPWLGALKEAGVALIGIYSIGLLTPQLAQSLGARKNPTLLVTLEQAGVRQSYIESGKIRFSRLGPLEPGEAEDADRVAEAFERETTRVHQYLTATRVISRDGGPVDAMLVAPSGEKARVRAMAPNIPQLRVSVFDLAEAASRIGLKALPRGAGAEALFVHLLARSRPAAQYAAEDLRSSFRLHQWRVGLIAGGALVGLACLAYAGLDLVRIRSLNDEILEDQRQISLSNQRYSQLAAKFPKLPTTTDNLRTTMQLYGRLTRQTQSPTPMLVEVSRALDGSPKIEIEKVRWDTGVNLRERRETGPGARPAAPPPPSAASDGSRYEVVELVGRVVVARVSDYRNITEIVNEFVANLRKEKDVEIVSVELPFDVASQRSLAGDIGVERVGETPRFTVVIARKVPA